MKTPEPRTVTQTELTEQELNISFTQQINHLLSDWLPFRILQVANGSLDEGAWHNSDWDHSHIS